MVATCPPLLPRGFDLAPQNSKGLQMQRTGNTEVDGAPTSHEKPQKCWRPQGGPCSRVVTRRLWVVGA